MNYVWNTKQHSDSCQMQNSLNTKYINNNQRILFQLDHLKQFTKKTHFLNICNHAYLDVGLNNVDEWIYDVA